MLKANALEFRKFDPSKELSALCRGLEKGYHSGYLTSYLVELGAADVLEESQYFDRDYLSEFTAFYGTSARGYPNVCRRRHFFGRGILTRSRFTAAAGGDRGALDELNAGYLGFLVVRPTAEAPFGRTVLRWYDDLQPDLPRVSSPSRPYHCHVAGLTLSVTGLAWQQQDRAVSACATVALWTMLHSSAFDDSHAIPTIADIARFAHRTMSLGKRVFPASGLNVHQICGAINECGLSPAVSVGSVPVKGMSLPGFAPARFASSCAALIRSGYPVLLGGELVNVDAKGSVTVVGPHAVTAVGFRQCAAPASSPDIVALQDGAIPNLYIHDDNIGPSARFEIASLPGPDASTPYVLLKRALPKERVARSHHWDETQGKYPSFRPTHIVAAVHEGLRMPPDTLHQHALAITRGLVKASGVGFATSSRFVEQKNFLGAELEKLFSTDHARLGGLRLALVEKVVPMSLHLGVVRVGYGDQPMLDVIIDTTDSDRLHAAFCHIVYDERMASLCQALQKAGAYDFGTQIDAF